MTGLRKTPRRASRACALALLLAIGACVVVEQQPATSAPPPANPSGEIAEFIALANEARADAGCTEPLILESDVAAVAQSHSEDMQRRDFFDHENPDGRTPMQRVLAYGIPVRAVAENIALGQPTGRVVLESWLDSPGHRQNLLNCDYTHHGVGLAGAYWTHVLVRLR